MLQLILHVFGDYFLQTDWQALNKKKPGIIGFWACLKHCTFYSIPFLFVGSWKAVLVIFITTFNLAGAIIILQLDKKEQSKSLISLGLNLKSLRNIYFYTGVLIVLFGLFSGLILGSAVSYFQMQTGIFKAGANTDLPFPVRIRLVNYLIVSATAIVFGFGVSWIFSKINKSFFKIK